VTNSCRKPESREIRKGKGSREPDADQNERRKVFPSMAARGQLTYIKEGSHQVGFAFDMTHEKGDFVVPLQIRRCRTLEKETTSIKIYGKQDYPFVPRKSLKGYTSRGRGNRGRKEVP